MRDKRSGILAKSGFIYSDDNKRYHTQNYHLRHTFGEKVTKISLDAGFTCPNIDGRCGVGGCIYCLDGSTSAPKLDLQSQYDFQREKLSSKWQSNKFIVYLQAHSNTYAHVDNLKKIYEEVLNFDKVVGLSVATRADCIDDDIADLLEEISKRTYLNVELGLQTTFDKTAKLINRGHNYEDFLSGYEKLKKRGIMICVHLINGLPGETTDMMMENVIKLNALEPFSIKLHLLHILKGTPLLKLYERGDFRAFELFDYVKLICDQLEYIRPETVIQRLTGDGQKDSLVAPLWSMKKFVVLDEIDKELEKRKSFQGIRL